MGHAVRRALGPHASRHTRRPLLALGVALRHRDSPRRVVFMPISSGRHGRSAGGIVRLLCLLWLAGGAMRMPLLAPPPVIPQLHDELHMSETQVGLLIGLPLAMLAVAAIPGWLLIARVEIGRAHV